MKFLFEKRRCEEKVRLFIIDNFTFHYKYKFGNHFHNICKLHYKKQHLTNKNHKLVNYFLNGRLNSNFHNMYKSLNLGYMKTSIEYMLIDLCKYNNNWNMIYI